MHTIPRRRSGLPGWWSESLDSRIQLRGGESEHRAHHSAPRAHGLPPNDRSHGGRVKMPGQYDMGFDPCGPLLHGLSMC